MMDYIIWRIRVLRCRWWLWLGTVLADLNDAVLRRTSAACRDIDPNG